MRPSSARMEQEQKTDTPSMQGQSLNSSTNKGAAGPDAAPRSHKQKAERRKMMLREEARMILDSVSRGLEIKLRQQIQMKVKKKEKEKKAPIDHHADDATLAAAMSKRSLDQIVSKYNFMYVTPLYWTHHHEKVFHVVWQPFTPPASVDAVERCRNRVKKLRQQQLRRRRRRPQRMKQQGQVSRMRKLAMKRIQKLWRRLSWDKRYRPLLTPSQFQALLSPPPPVPLVSPGSFELAEWGDGSDALQPVIDLAKGCPVGLKHSRVFCFKQLLKVCRQRGLQKILGGVDRLDSCAIYNRIPPLQNYLRLSHTNVSIQYGRRTYKFLQDLPIYRLRTKTAGVSLETSDNCSSISSGSSSSKNKLGYPWRLLHLDGNALFSKEMEMEESHDHKRGRNFLREVDTGRKGLSMAECTARYDYASGTDKWSHPHLIPGVFIGLEQRARRKRLSKQQLWGEGGKTGGGVGSQKETSDVQRDFTQVPSRRKPVWQIIVTDAPNDTVYAHLYTARVPEYLIASFERPGRPHVHPRAPPPPPPSSSPLPPTTTTNTNTHDGSNGCNGSAENANANNSNHHTENESDESNWREEEKRGEKKEEERIDEEEAQFEFPIRYTRIPYRPYDTFRSRLRHAIVSARDNLGGAGNGI